MVWVKTQITYSAEKASLNINYVQNFSSGIESPETMLKHMATSYLHSVSPNMVLFLYIVYAIR